MALTFDAKSNFAYSVVAVAPVSATAGTSLEVAPGDGAKFPAAPFNAVIWPTAVQPTVANAEVVRVTAIAGDVLTITRTQEGSNNRTVIVNDQIALNVTAKTFTDIQTAFTTASVLATPIGAVFMWMSDTAPTGYIFLRGQAISRATYATLFALWGTTYGVGDGATTFNVPNMQVRIPIGRDSTGANTAVDTLGETQGSWDHTHGPGTLTVASHLHNSGTLTVASHTHDSGTLTVASHTHGAGTLTVASHTHGAGTYAADSHSHGVGSISISGGDHTHTTDSSGDHTHDLQGVTFDSVTSGSDFSVVTDIGAATTSGGSHTHNISSSGSHSHSASGSTDSSTPAVSGTSGAASPAITSGTTGSTAPAVSSGSTGASAPAVGSGVTGTAAPAVSTGITAAANPPVLVVNYIARATNEV